MPPPNETSSNDNNYRSSLARDDPNLGDVSSSLALGKGESETRMLYYCYYDHIGQKMGFSTDFPAFPFGILQYS